MNRRPFGFALAVALGIPTASASLAFAQQGPVDPNAGAGAGTTTQTSGGATTQSQIVYPYGFAPPAPGQPVGGGNATESSARPITGEKEDSFDLGPRAGAGGTAFGSSNSPVFFENSGNSHTLGNGGGPPPSQHTVRKGDTLWSICDGYFHNPYQWPRIWSYNPQIQNPHWIYPNEQVRLKPGVALNTPQVEMKETAGPGGLVDRRRTVPAETIFLRDEGFIDDESGLNWGSITGAPEDKMFLTDFDEAYVRIGPDHDVKLGQELTVFRPVRTATNGTGTVISIGGTLRVDQWNPQTRIARAQVVETLDTIERGARVGPIARRFEVVSPVRNEVDVRSHVLVAVRPHVFYGQDQVVFIDKGAEDGLKPGNRLFVIRRGDAWRGSMGTDRTADRVPMEKDTIGEVEPTPRIRDEKQYPEEIIGELRVLNTQKKSATCYVTRARGEIEINDDVVARKGY